MIEGQAARLAARPPPAPWAPSGITAKPWSVHQNNKITQLFANKEELEKQMTCLQKQNDELKKESTQLKEALSESETLEVGSIMPEQHADLLLPEQVVL